MGRTIRIGDMYKEKYPEEYKEKFPQKKEEANNLSPSERARMDEAKEEIIQKPRPEGTEPVKKNKGEKKKK